MFDQKWQSVEEIDKAYSDHLGSLRKSGMEFDEVGLVKEWAEAIANFQEGKTSPPWLSH